MTTSNKKKIDFPVQVGSHTSNSIDAARGLAALGVIYGHSIYGLDAPVELNGAFWVWIFLVISGYLVGHGFFHGRYDFTISGYLGFLWNRALRILPLAWIALFTSLIVVLYSGAEVSGPIWPQFIFLPPLNNMSLVGALWTVAAEVQFYIASVLVVGVYWWLRRVQGQAAATWLMPALLVACLWTVLPMINWLGDNTSQPRTLLGNAPFFLVGIVLALPALPPLICRPGTKIVVAVGLVFLAWWLQNFKPGYFWAWGNHTTWPLGAGATCAIAFSILVLWTAPNKEILSDQTVSTSSSLMRSRGFFVSSSGSIVRALAWCGFYTYGIYVFHAILLIVDKSFLQLPNGVAKFAWLSLALAIAPLSYRLIERPFLQLKKRSQSGKVA